MNASITYGSYCKATIFVSRPYVWPCKQLECQLEGVSAENVLAVWKRNLEYTHTFPAKDAPSQ